MIKLRSWEKKSPVWRVWVPDRGETEDDAHEIEASDAEQAAEDFAEWDDMRSADYLFVRGNEAVVHVQGKESGSPVCRFRVSGEAVPSYTARELE